MKNLTAPEFEFQMQRIAEVFGKHAASREKVKMIWQWAIRCSEEEFVDVVNRLIANSTKAPLPADFKTLITAKLQSASRPASSQVLEARAVKSNQCHYCHDMGMCGVKHRESGVKTLCYCDCELPTRGGGRGGQAYGKTSQYQVPYFSEELAREWEKIPRELSFFKPPKSGDRFEKTMLAQVTLMRAQFRVAEEIWAGIFGKTAPERSSPDSQFGLNEL